MGDVVIGIANGSAFALVAVGIVLIYRCTRVLSIAQGEIGAFGTFIGIQWAKAGIPGLGWHPPLIGILLIAVVTGALIGLVVERVIMRPLVQRPPLDNLIATLGIALFLALAELRIYGPNIVFAPSPVGAWSIKLFGATLVAPRVVALLLAALVAAALFAFFARSKFGLAVQATTSDPTVARILGVPVTKVYRFAWVVGGGLAGLAAALLSGAFSNITPFAQTQFALRALAGAVIGGLDSIQGAIVGSLLVGVVVELVRSVVSTTGSGEVAVLALVILTLLVRPRGLFGVAGLA